MELKPISSLLKNNIIFIRSCENKGRLAGCLTGWLDDKLSDYGRLQAKYLSINLFHDIELKRRYKLISSDLKRADETIKILTAYKDNLNITNTSLLRDIGYGEYEGYFYDGQSNDFKKQVSSRIYKFNKGESYIDVKFRSLYFTYKYLNDLKGDETKVIITHNILLKSIFGMNSTDIQSIRLKDFISLDLLSETREVIDLYKKENYKKRVNEEMIVKFDTLLRGYYDYSSIERYEIPDVSEEKI